MCSIIGFPNFSCLMPERQNIVTVKALQIIFNKMNSLYVSMNVNFIDLASLHSEYFCFIKL